MINDEIRDAVSNGKLGMITGVVQSAIEEGVDSADILDSMMVAMDEVGDKFQNNDIYVPEMLIAAKTMERGIAVLKPKFSINTPGTHGKVIIGTVAGDLHDIGKNLVSTMMQAAGFEVIDLGIDVSSETFLQTLKENPDCKVIALSALLSFTLDSMRETVAAIRKTKIGKQVKIMVGGAPVTEAYARQIGADYYSKDAVEATKLVKQIAALENK